MMTQVQILAAPEAIDAVSGTVFAETTTLGLRWETVSRRTLSRRAGELDVEGYRVRAKIAQRAGERTAKAESEDLRKVEGGHAARERVRRAAEEEGLKNG
jgi:uncharacterized protein (DUF111 family)